MIRQIKPYTNQNDQGKIDLLFSGSEITYMREDKRGRLVILLLVISLTAVIAYVVIRINMAGHSEETVETRTNDIHIQMSWWGNDARHMYTMEGVEIFHENNPDIDVDYRYGEWSGYEKRNKVWMESHTQADVMQINYAWLNEYSSDGTGFYDLNELADYIDLDNFTDEEKSYGMQKGRLNALPIAMNTHTFYYNKDILDK